MFPMQRLEKVQVTLPAVQLAAWAIAVRAISGVLADEGKQQESETLCRVAQALEQSVPEIKDGYLSLVEA